MRLVYKIILIMSLFFLVIATSCKNVKSNKKPSVLVTKYGLPSNVVITSHGDPTGKKTTTALVKLATEPQCFSKAFAQLKKSAQAYQKSVAYLKPPSPVSPLSIKLNQFADAITNNSNLETTLQHSISSGSYSDKMMANLNNYPVMAKVAAKNTNTILKKLSSSSQASSSQASSSQDANSKASSQDANSKASSQDANSKASSQDANSEDDNAQKNKKTRIAAAVILLALGAVFTIHSSYELYKSEKIANFTDEMPKHMLVDSALWGKPLFLILVGALAARDLIKGSKETSVGELDDLSLTYNMIIPSIAVMALIYHGLNYLNAKKLAALQAKAKKNQSFDEEDIKLVETLKITNTAELTQATIELNKNFKLLKESGAPQLEGEEKLAQISTWVDNELKKPKSQLKKGKNSEHRLAFDHLKGDVTKIQALQAQKKALDRFDFKGDGSTKSMIYKAAEEKSPDLIGSHLNLKGGDTKFDITTDKKSEDFKTVEEVQRESVWGMGLSILIGAGSGVMGYAIKQKLAQSSDQAPLTPKQNFINEMTTFSFKMALFSKQKSQSINNGCAIMP